MPPAEYRWTPGQSGNPAGRPKAAGLSVREWLNIMAEWSRPDVTAILKDQSAPVNKVTAARWWFDAASAARTKGGLPVADGAAKEICNQTAGKPAQPHDHASSGPLEIIVRYVKSTARRYDLPSPAIPELPCPESSALTSPNSTPGKNE